MPRKTSLGSSLNSTCSTSHAAATACLPGCPPDETVSSSREQTAHAYSSTPGTEHHSAGRMRRWGTDVNTRTTTVRGVRGYKGVRHGLREPRGASRQARRGAGAAGGTHQSLVHVRVRPFGRRRRILGVAQTLAGRGDATTGSHGKATQGGSVRRGVAYETAAGTN